MERLSQNMWLGPKCNQKCAYKREAERFDPEEGSMMTSAGFKDGERGQGIQGIQL